MPKQLDFERAYRYIDELFDEKLIGDGTYQCTADIYQLCDENNDPDGEFLEEVLAMSEQQLADWRRQEVLDWKEDLSEEEWAERFEIGEGRAFKSIDQLIECTEFGFILSDLLSNYVESKEVGR